MKPWLALRLCVAEVTIRVLIGFMPPAARVIWLNQFATTSARCATLYEDFSNDIFQENGRGDA